MRFHSVGDIEVKNTHWVLVHTVCDFQYFLTHSAARGSWCWVLFPLKKTKQKQKRNFSSLELLMMDENVGKCLELPSRSLFQQAIHPRVRIANTNRFCCRPCTDAFGYWMTCFVPGWSALLQGGRDSCWGLYELVLRFCVVEEMWTL